MKNPLIIICATILLCSSACKKNETSSIHQHTIEPNTTAPANEVKQKMYDLPTEVITEAVRNFKGVNTTHTANNSIERTSSSDLQADSSIFILEAALNYDFDKIPTGSETSQDTCSFEINYTNNSVSSTDLTSAYNYFNQYINQKTSGINKVKIIDITAYLTNSKITYVANITYFPDLAQRTEGLCDPYSHYSANWSNSWMTTYGCTFSGNDGPQACNTKLNCNIAIGGCDGFYWANVTTVTLGQSGPWTGLYYSPNRPDVCHESVLNSTNLNSAISTAQSYGASNLPSSPSGMHIAGYNVIARVMPGTYFATLTMWWELDITYGTYGCGSGGGQ